MKKIKYTLLSFIVATSSISSAATMMDYLKDYGLPCAAGLIAGSLASKDKEVGTAIGIGVCFGSGTATYVNRSKEQSMKDEDFKKFIQLMDEHSTKVLTAQDEKVEKSLKALEEKQDKQIEAVRQVMKEVIAERMTLVSEESKADIKRYVEKAEFMQDLEKKVMEKMREDVKIESKLRQSEIVEKCVDEALSQLVLKKVGTTPEQ